MTDRHETNNAARDVREGAALIQARDIGHVILNSGAEAGPEPERDPWVATVAESRVWRHVPEGRDTEPFRAAVVEFVRSLVPLRDEAQERLREDPWLDPGVPLRFHDRLTQLLGSPGQAEDLDLYPAEAALLVFTPFLFRVYELRRAVALADLDPGSLTEVEAPSPERRSFEAFVGEYRVLTERVRRRDQDEEAVGWWLFHRWVLKAENSVGVEDLWRPAPELFHRLWKTGRVKHFLHGLRLGPGVCNPEHLGGLRADEYVPVEGAQQLRERRLGLILALGFGMSLEAASLPETILEHLAIPHPVDPVRLQETVETAGWGSDRHLLTLSAECHHEAVIEGLREQVQRVDELLHGVHRSLRAHVANLPSRLSADLVEPADGAFDGWARFRIDERRARELLTGEQLYKNKDLAIRELYQNALDACRYRRARTQYLDRCNPVASFDYEGRIEFIQGVDDDGRTYVDCIDNGVGMGEAELRGVFSHAGSRFAEQSDFLREKEKWEQLDPPVELYPNSRFGIGVLSYFMLADEIRVTTCRMHADGSLGPELEAMIHGPGHLFRITDTGSPDRIPGTTVRLYLKGDAAKWSCVEVLRGDLGVSEFRVTATASTEELIWEPGEFATREALDQEELAGYAAGGASMVWENSSVQADVLWCESGGGLLVDGLYVEPARRGGVFTQAGSGLFGVIVNLRGSEVPRRLSADRSQVLSDIEPRVREILTEAAECLVSSESSPLYLTWISDVMGRSVALADVIADSVNRRGESALIFRPNPRYRNSDAFSPPVKGSGFFVADLGMVGVVEESIDVRSARSSSQRPNWDIRDRNLPPHFLLWRIMAGGEPRVRQELIDLCPELGDIPEVRRALPSDRIMIAERFTQHSSPGWDGDPEQEIPRIALKSGMSYHEILERLYDLGFLRVPHFLLRLALKQSELDLVKLRHLFVVALPESGEVSPLVLLRAAISCSVEPETVARVLREKGMEVSEAVVELAGDPVLKTLLHMSMESPYPTVLEPGQALRICVLTKLSMRMDMPVGEVRSRIAELGFSVPEILSSTEGLMSFADRLWYAWPDPWSGGDDPIGPESVILHAELLQMEPVVVAEELRKNLLPVSDYFPEDSSYDDLEILFDGSDRLVPPFGYRYKNIIDRVPFEDINRVCGRLREYGFDVPLRVPDDPDELDLNLVVRGHLWWSKCSPLNPMPLSHVLFAARKIEESVGEIITRLESYGVRVSSKTLPEGLNSQEAIEILRPLGGLEVPAGYSRVGLARLLRSAERARCSVSQMVSWLRGLGIWVVDPAEEIREAIPYIPLREPRRG